VKNIAEQYSSQFAKDKGKIPKFNVGDTVRVHFRIVEGDKERVQAFEGVCIARKNGDSPEATFTVRRVVYNEGVERVFPLHSPRVEKVQVTREGQTRARGQGRPGESQTAVVRDTRNTVFPYAMVSERAGSWSARFFHGLEIRRAEGWKGARSRHCARRSTPGKEAENC